MALPGPNGRGNPPTIKSHADPHTHLRIRPVLVLEPAAIGPALSWYWNGLSGEKASS